MITEILDNLKEVTLTKNLDDEQKVTRKKLSDKLLTEVKETIFQLFYEDFFAYSYWNVGYPKNGISLSIRNSSYSTYLKINFDFKDKCVLFERVVQDYKKIYDLYYFPVKSSVLEKYELRGDIKSSHRITEFNNIDNTSIYNAISEISEDIEKVQSIQFDKFKNIDDSELFFFNQDYKLNIDIDEFDKLINDLQLFFDSEFIKSESLKIYNEINRTDNIKQKDFLTNLLAHLNLRLIFKYVYLSKEDGMDKSEIKFMIEQLYKGLIDAINKWDPKAGAYTTYAFNRVLNKFQRGTTYVVRERVYKKTGHRPAFHTIEKHKWETKRNSDRYLSLEELTKFALDVSMEKIAEKEKKKKKEEKHNIKVSLQYLLLSEFGLQTYDLNLIKKTYDHIREISSVVLNDPKAYDIIHKRYKFNETYKISKPVVLEEIGSKYSITRERVRQIEKEGLDIINKAISLFPVGVQIDTEYLEPLLKKGESRGRKTTSKFTEYDWLIKFFKLNEIFFLGEFKELNFNDKKMKLPRGTVSNNISKAIFEQKKLDDNYIEDKNLIIHYDLSVRSRNVLEREGIELVSDIVIEDVPNLKNVGIKSVVEIQQMVLEYRSSQNNF